MIKRILKFCKTSLFNLREDYLIWRRKHNEIKKYRDGRRIEIYNKVTLSDDQMKKIDSLYLNNYGKKISYAWHRHYTAFTGKFDENYFPELLYIPEFERFMNVERA